MAKTNIVLSFFCSVVFLVISIIYTLPSLSNESTIRTSACTRPSENRWSTERPGSDGIVKMPQFHLKSKTSDGFIKGMYPY